MGFDNSSVAIWGFAHDAGVGFTSATAVAFDVLSSVVADCAGSSSTDFGLVGVGSSVRARGFISDLGSSPLLLSTADLTSSLSCVVTVCSLTADMIIPYNYLRQEGVGGGRKGGEVFLWRFDLNDVMEMWDERAPVVDDGNAGSRWRCARS